MNEIKYLCSNILGEHNVNDDSIDLLNAARAFLQCKESEAEENINNIIKNSENQKTISKAQEILLSILFWQGRYLEIEKLALLPDEKKNLVASIIGFYHNPQCEVLVNDVHSIIDMPNIMEGLPAITVKINGIDVDLLFDTGSMVTVLSEGIARKCGVNIDSQQSTLEGQDAAGNILNPIPSQINNIKINGIEIINKTCLLLPDEMLEFGIDESGKVRRIDGTIGWDIIKDFKWTINAKDKMVIIDASQASNEMKNFCCDFYPMVNVSYEGKNMCLGLDTGANNTVLRKSMATELGKLDKTNVKTYSAGNITHEEGFRISELDLFIGTELAEIKNATVREQLHNNTNNFILPGVIGFDIAKNKKMVIDFPNRLFSLEK